VKESRLFKSGFSILPSPKIRIGNEVFPLYAASSMTVRAWRSLINLYNKATPAEQAEFRQQARAMILADSSSVVLLETDFIHSIFKGHEAMYLDFLATAYYAKGNLKKAYQCFVELQKLEPSDLIYLHMARCLMHTGTSEEVFAMLQEGCTKYPQSPFLLMSLASAYFRAGKTSQANETLRRIDAGILKNIQEKSHNLSILQNEVNEALTSKTIVRPVENLGFQKYAEGTVQDYWEDLFFHFTAKTRFQHGWSDLCYITEKKLSDFIDKYKDVKTVLNFGVFCAVPDYNLSRKYPSLNFIGVDREQDTKDLNDAAFHAPNVSFHAIDMIDIIYEDRNEVKNFIKKEITKGEMMIFHARTTTLIYPEAVKQFYNSCAKLGVKYIALYENMSLSRTHMQYFDFDELPADAIPYYSIMMIHNYKKYLEDAGYEIVEKEVWGYSELLWEGKDLYGVENWLGLGDSHICLLARLK
jgi:tetratricopeptide (TPR) repeat protein